VCGGGGGMVGVGTAHRKAAAQSKDKIFQTLRPTGVLVFRLGVPSPFSTNPHHLQPVAWDR
jgi:hypothetical protein